MATTFLGEFTHSVDSKGRVAVPNPFRRQLPSASEGKFVLLRGRDRTIEVHPLSEWKEFANRTLHKLPLYQRRSQRVRRFRFSSATTVGLDSQGRILLPRHLREEAGIDGEAVLAGVGAYIEIWEPGAYRAFIEQARQAHDDDLAYLEEHDWQEKAEYGGETGDGVPPAGDGR